MSTLLPFTKNIAKIGLLLLGIAITSCNALKRVGDDELLLTKNHIYVDDKKVTAEDINSFILQRPNSTLLGYPLRLNLYNLAKENPDSSFQDWLFRKEKREKRLVGLLSKKQVTRLGESFLVKGASVWLKKIGEAPVIIDTSKTRKSLRNLKSYYGSKGYFNNNASYVIDSSRRKQRAEVVYQLQLGKPFFVDSLSKNITSKAIDSIYEQNATASLVKEGEQFDLSHFNNERKRLTAIFRNNGIYNFQESSINYDIKRDTIKVSDDQKMDVSLNIENLKTGRGNSNATSEYKVYTFDKINIYADYIFADDPSQLDTVNYKNYIIHYKNKLRYKPKALTDAIFIQKDSVYRDIDRIRTQRQITNLNTFKYPNIEFIPDSTQAKLTANIYLSARPKYSLGLDFDVTHSNIERIGTAFSSSLVTRNIFGGAETLSFSVRGSLGLLSDASISDENFVSEIGGDINLTFPRIWSPILNTNSIIPNYMLPQTKIAIGTSFQKNIGLDKQTFNTVLGYNWSPSDFKKNSFELLNIQFVRNVNPQNFFKVYGTTYRRLDDIADNYDDGNTYPDLAQFFETVGDNPDPRLIVPEGTTGFINAVKNNGLIPVNSQDYKDVNSIEERRRRLTENNLIFTSNYSFSLHNKSDITDNNFYQFRFKLESAGNLLSGISKIIPFDKNENQNSLVFGVPFSQYIKTEFNFIKHWDLSRFNVLAFRTFFGIAIPYGNSNDIPFVRSYFAGGSNDNRAWNAYSLGPGRTQDLNDFNEANLKLAFNLEYRFPIVGDIKGALFADAGNIWNVFDSVDDPNATFNGFTSLADIALGTGFGLRYDFNYFVFRLDTGFKTYNPASSSPSKWFSEYNFANAVFNIGINYPF